MLKMSFGKNSVMGALFKFTFWNLGHVPEECINCHEIKLTKCDLVGTQYLEHYLSLHFGT